MQTELSTPHPAPGFHDMENQAYHDGPGLSSTPLKELILKSPAHARVKKEPTAAMRFGSALHARVLEPELFEKSYAVLPEGVTLRQKEGKEIAARAAKKGMEMLSRDDADTIEAMFQALKDNKTARNLLFDLPGVNEQAAFWVDPYTEVLCKCKPDRRIDSKRFLIDLKTCTDASARAFARDIFKFGYYISADFYLKGISRLMADRWRAFVLVAVEKTEPFGVKTYPLSDMWLMMGDEQVRAGLQAYARCLHTGHWPKYRDAAEDIHPEAWMINQVLPPE